MTDENHINSGFSECWSEYPEVQNHIKDLFYIGAIGGWRTPLANRLIQEKNISLENFPVGELKEGARARRQKIQIAYTLKDQEWIDKQLQTEIESWEYPLHFIDFETTLSAIPFHKGMRPYEVINFQWSCHTIENPNDQPIHHEWINLEPSFPSFKFAESLMAIIKNKGTTLIWSQYENTMLKTIYDQLYKYDYKNDELKEWLEFMIKFDKNDVGNFVDMNKLTLDYYFYPYMKGKTSIKWTLPAVLKSSNTKSIEQLLNNFEPSLSLLQKDENNEIIDPYKLLPPIEIYDFAESINEGTGAMRAYEDILFGVNKGNTEIINEYRTALLRYCKLDTLAMVIIWQHWKNLLGI